MRSCFNTMNRNYLYWYYERRHEQNYAFSCTAAYVIHLTCWVWLLLVHLLRQKSRCKTSKKDLANEPDFLQSTKPILNQAAKNVCTYFSHANDSNCGAHGSVCPEHGSQQWHLTLMSANYKAEYISVFSRVTLQTHCPRVTAQWMLEILWELIPWPFRCRCRARPTEPHTINKEEGGGSPK